MTSSTCYTVLYGNIGSANIGVSCAGSEEEAEGGGWPGTKVAFAEGGSWPWKRGQRINSSPCALRFRIYTLTQQDVYNIHGRKRIPVRPHVGSAPIH